VIEVSLYAFVKRDGPIDDNEPINEWDKYTGLQSTLGCNYHSHTYKVHVENVWIYIFLI
jgi:hypothetical protein